MIERAHAPRIPRIGLALVLAACALAAADDLPKAENLLDKFIEVTGGKTAYGKLHNMVMTGTMEFKPMGLKGKLSAYATEPDKFYMEITLDGVGKIQNGSNGELAWGNSAMQGPRIEEGDERAETLLHNRFNSYLVWRDLYKSVETAGVETVDGKACYKVVLIPKAGKPVTHWYDKETNLLLKMSMVAKSPMGEMQSESMFSDYGEADGILLPRKMLTHVATMDMVMTIDSIRHNTEIPMGTFDIPEGVQALLKKQAK